jgi:chaperonin cofactor prefoldin
MGAATAGALYVHSAAAAAVRPVEEKVAAVTTDVTTLKAQRDDDRDRLRRIETKLDAIGTAVGAHGP